MLFSFHEKPVSWRWGPGLRGSTGDVGVPWLHSGQDALGPYPSHGCSSSGLAEKIRS